MRAIENRAASSQAYATLKDQLERCGTKLVRGLGFQGGHHANLEVLWLEEHRIWVHLSRRPDLARFWICLGEEIEASSLPIVVECNPPKAGIDRRTAGVFIADGRDLFLGHTGKVGGGRKGIGKVAFRSWYRGGLHTVEWSDEYQEEIIVIGRIGASTLPAHLARFVRQVSEFKAIARGKAQDSGKRNPEVSFVPEFRGTVTDGTRREEIEVSFFHGHVVDALQRLVVSTLVPANDDQRDLYCVGQDGRTVALFEVKTSMDTTSIYTGVGQLPIHGAALPANVPRVLVVPDSPTGELAVALGKVGIVVLPYAVTDGSVRFGRLPAALAGTLRA